MYKIEKGIPAPVPHRNRGRWVDLLRSMKVGESFELPGGLAQTLRYSISQGKKRGAIDGNYMVRVEGNGETARCWRVKH